MSKILEWLKTNAQLNDGVNIDDLKPIIEENNPLNQLKTDDQKDAFIKANFLPQFNRAVDSAVKNHDTKFQNEKLPGLLEAERKKTLDEVNKPETAEQIEIRELKQWKEGQVRKNQLDERKRSMRDLATKLEADKVGLTAEIFEPFAIFGEEAEKTATALHAAVSNRFNELLEQEKQKLYGGKAPTGGDQEASANQMKRSDWNQLSNKEKSAFALKGGELID